MTDGAVRHWTELDAARAIHPHDRVAVSATEAARALVVERACAMSEDRKDLFTACATLGRLLFEAGASPTLASATIDGAAAALASIGAPPLDEATLASARASVAEGYTSALVASERARARSTWEWPACVASLDGETCAITAGHPGDEAEAVASWAGRVATRAQKAGVKRAVVAGQGAARDELDAALRLVGVEVLERLEPSPSAGRSWLPWRRK